MSWAPRMPSSNLPAKASRLRRRVGRASASSSTSPIGPASAPRREDEATRKGMDVIILEAIRRSRPASRRATAQSINRVVSGAPTPADHHSGVAILPPGPDGSHRPPPALCALLTVARGRLPACTPDYEAGDEPPRYEPGRLDQGARVISPTLAAGSGSGRQAGAGRGGAATTVTRAVFASGGARSGEPAMRGSVRRRW